MAEFRNTENSALKLWLAVNGFQNK